MGAQDKMAEKGIWIAFEGNDGSGKTTQIRDVAKYFRSHGKEVIETREPGGNNYSEQVRKLIFDHEVANDPQSQLLLFAVSRRRNIIDVVLPARKEGKIIISDRSEGSTYAYQHYQFGLSLREVQEINDFATDGIKPDLTVLLDVDIETAYARMLKAKGIEANHFDIFDRDAWLKRSYGYRQLARQNSKSWITVDANKEKEVVFQQLIDRLEQILA